MKKFKTAHCGIVDLDDDSTYSYMSKDIDVLRKQIHQEIGYYYCYVNYWHNPWCAKQEARVELLIEKYTKEWRDNINDLRWHQETLYIILDETENMC
jgi:uncharacterized FlgJ-related protein